MNYAPLYGILRQSRINTENKLMNFSDSSWQYCPDIFIITGAFIVFYQGGPIFHGTHVPVPVSQSSAKS